MQFGTSGLRGLVTDMTDARCAAYTAAFLRHLRAQGLPAGSVLIGRDLRPSSPRIAAACAASARRAGHDTLDCGVLPTPALALEAMRRGCPAIMVTGSHIPFDRNGLKFYRPDGEIAKADEAGILAALSRDESLAGTPGRATDEPEARARYLHRAEAFAPGVLGGMRVGVYQHSAAGRDLLPEALQRLGADVVTLGRTDAFVPVDTEAVAEADRARARAWVAAHNLDALVTTDGDGDRPLIADETGNFLRGDGVGLLTARYLGADAVATPISSTTAVERTGWFAQTLRTKIGSPHVIAALETLGRAGAAIPAGFEANGGFLLGGRVTLAHGGVIEALPTRDALLPILAVLSMAAETGGTLSHLAACLPARVTASDRIPEVPLAASAAFLAALTDDPAFGRRVLHELGERAVERTDLTDGVRLHLDADEIVHFRASGNAPELRCYVEAAESTRAALLLATALEGARRLLTAG